MKSQDFEQYAVDRPINYNVADTWERVLSEARSRLAKDNASMSVLDYGCGDGKYFHVFKDKGFLPENIYGIEVSKLRVERCREIGWTNAEYMEKGSRLPYPDETFDLINFMEVIEHIPAASADQVVYELRRVLKRGGFLLVSTPNYPIKRFYDLVDAFVSRLWRRLRDDPTHVTFYNHKRLHALLDGYFSSVEERVYKPGFLYKRWPRRFFLHKLFFLCRA